jgi:hypothetical protein
MPHQLTAHARYAAMVIATAMAACAIVATLNLAVDPYGAYRLVSTPETAVKPAVYRRVKLAKAYDLRRIKPEALVLGTSRSHLGLRMSHAGWSVPRERRYNAAFDGATTKEMYAYLLHASAIAPLRQVVLGLDFWHLGQVPASARPDFDPSILFVPSTPLHNAAVYAGDIRLLISLDTTRASLAELTSGSGAEPSWFAQDGQRLGEVFFHTVEPQFVASPAHYFRAIDRQEVGYMLDVPPAHPARNGLRPDTNMGSGATSMDYIRLIVAFCREHSIDLRIFLTPSHAHQLEIAGETGAWPAIEQGKRELVALLARDAAQHPAAQPFVLYDFATYSSVTNEPVPPTGTPREMAYYWDSSHFKERVGDWVLDRLFGLDGPNDPVPDDFGVQLTPQTVEAALEKTRADRAIYERRNGEDLRFIRALVRDAKQSAAREPAT